MTAPKDEISKEQNNDQDVVNDNDVVASKLGTIFPTLSLKVQQLPKQPKNGIDVETTTTTNSADHVLQPFLANSTNPVAFETELFKGHLLLLLQTPNGRKSDPIYQEQIFEVKNRSLEFQVQGKFKRLPKGPLYMGIEITEKEMKIGLVTKGVCNVLLNFMNKRLGVDVHHSFGDSKGKEYPHIVFPLQNIDRLIETSPGEEPPKLGTLIEEDSHHMKQRKSTSSSNFIWSTTTTYTFTFNTMYIDLHEWQAVRFPMLKSLDLHTFWGDSDMRMVAYEVPPPSSSNKDDNKHIQKQLNYVFCAQATFKPNGDAASEFEHILPATEEEEEESLEGEGEAEVEERNNNNDNKNIQRMSIHSLPSWDQVKPRRMRSIETDDDPFGDQSSGNNDVKNDDDDDEQQTISSSEEDKSDVGSEGFEIEDDDDDDNDNYDNETIGDTSTVYHDALDFSDRLSSSMSMGGTENDVLPCSRDWLCPGWIDFCNSKNGGYSRMYAFNLFRDDNNSKETFFCEGKHFDHFFDRNTKMDLPTDETIMYDNYYKSHQFHRLSKAEQKRRQMGDTLSMICQNLSPEDLEQLFQTNSLDNKLGNFYHKSFMNTELMESPACSVIKHRKSNTPRFKVGSKAARAGATPLGFVARAVSERHWIEQAASITKHHVVFSHPSRKIASYRIHLASIIRVRNIYGSNDAELLGEEVETNILPSLFPTFSFSVIETPGRRIYIMHPTAMHRDVFVHKVLERVSSQGSTNLESTSYTSRRYVSDDPSQEYLHKSSIWRTKGRRILNCRKFYFGDDHDYDGVCSRTSDPCAMVEHALEQALALHDESTESDLVTFLDATADLKQVNLSDMGDECQKKCFFINLYHLMVTHAYFVVGPPTSSSKWPSFFNTMSYQISDDIVSLAEVEHCILRASMSRPSRPLVAKFVLPTTSKYPTFALTQPDFRFNFALNCGSESNPTTIPIYRTDTLDEQLDQVTRTYLKNLHYMPSSSSSSSSTATSSASASAPSPSESGGGGGGGGTLTLPRICYWYRQDFVISSNNKDDDSGGGNFNLNNRAALFKRMVATLFPYLPSNIQKQLAVGCSTIKGDSNNNDKDGNKQYIDDNDIHHVHVRFSGYSFRCRPLILEDSNAV